MLFVRQPKTVNIFQSSRNLLVTFGGGGFKVYRE